MFGTATLASSRRCGERHPARACHCQKWAEDEGSVGPSLSAVCPYHTPSVPAKKPDGWLNKACKPTWCRSPRKELLEDMNSREPSGRKLPSHTCGSASGKL